MDRENKIARAVESCLGEVEFSEAPFRRVDHFLWLLQSDPAWREEEIVAVRTEVVRELMKRAGLVE
jgi:hypothetical protein